MWATVVTVMVVMSMVTMPSVVKAVLEAASAMYAAFTIHTFAVRIVAAVLVPMMLMATVVSMTVMLVAVMPQTMKSVMTPMSQIFQHMFGVRALAQKWALASYVTFYFTFCAAIARYCGDRKHKAGHGKTCNEC